MASKKKARKETAKPRKGGFTDENAQWLQPKEVRPSTQVGFSL